jgi:hypothetical protein
MGMMIGRPKAVRIVGPERLALLLQSVEGGWAKFEDRIRPWYPLCSPTGMATMIHEGVKDEVRRQFEGVPGAIIHDGTLGRARRFLLELDRRLIVQFKKLTEDFHTVNNPTETSEAFDNQQRGCDELPDLPRLTVGYQLGQYGTSLAGIWMAFVVGKEAAWYHDLQSGEYSTQFVFPHRDRSAADEEVATEEERRRRMEQENEEEEDSG